MCVRSATVRIQVGSPGASCVHSWGTFVGGSFLLGAPFLRFVITYPVLREGHLSFLLFFFFLYYWGTTRSFVSIFVDETLVFVRVLLLDFIPFPACVVRISALPIYFFLGKKQTISVSARARHESRLVFLRATKDIEVVRILRVKRLVTAFVSRRLPGRTPDRKRYTEKCLCLCYTFVTRLWVPRLAGNYGSCSLPSLTGCATGFLSLGCPGSFLGIPGFAPVAFTGEKGEEGERERKRESASTFLVLASSGDDS